MLFTARRRVTVKSRDTPMLGPSGPLHHRTKRDINFHHITRYEAVATKSAAAGVWCILLFLVCLAVDAKAMGVLMRFDMYGK